MNKSFFAMMSRMKYIDRWALMRNSRTENISEHSLEVAMLAHCLAVLGNKRFQRNLNENRIALLAMYHDSTEIITGDMPTPIKYYNQDIKTAFKEVEKKAARHLLSMLPEDLQEAYEPIFIKQPEDDYLWKLVKGADKLSALIKCIEERKAGNSEFSSAERALKTSLTEMKLDEVEDFMKDFLPAYERTLDDLNSL